MTAPMMQIKRYPIRGAIYGLLLGVGVAIYLLIFSIITFGDWVSTIIAVAAGLVVGVLWSMFAPAKKAKGAPPGQIGGGYVPAGQPIAATAPQVQQVPMQPPPAQAPPAAASPGQQQYAPMTGIPGAPPPAPQAPAPPGAADLQPSFLTDDAPLPPPPGGGSRETVVARQDDAADGDESGDVADGSRPPA